MWILSYLLMTALMLLGLFLIGLILLQRGRGGGLAGAFGGMGGQSAFGTKAGDVFTRITIGVAAAWILLCAGSVVALHHTSGNRADVNQFKSPDAAGATIKADGLGTDEPPLSSDSLSPGLNGTAEKKLEEPKSDQPVKPEAPAKPEDKPAVQTEAPKSEAPKTEEKKPEEQPAEKKAEAAPAEEKKPEAAPEKPADPKPAEQPATPEAKPVEPKPEPQPEKKPE